MTITNQLVIKTGLAPGVQVRYMERLMNQKKLTLVQARAYLQMMVIVEKQFKLFLPKDFNLIFKTINQLTKIN